MAEMSKKERMEGEDLLIQALAAAFGDNVRRVRERKNISQTTLAYMLGYASHTRVSDIERGLVAVSLRDAARIGRALEVSDLGELIDLGAFRPADYPEPNRRCLPRF